MHQRFGLKCEIMDCQRNNQGECELSKHNMYDVNYVDPEKCKHRLFKLKCRKDKDFSG